MPNYAASHLIHCSSVQLVPCSIAVNDFFDGRTVCLSLSRSQALDIIQKSEDKKLIHVSSHSKQIWSPPQKCPHIFGFYLGWKYLFSFPVVFPQKKKNPSFVNGEETQQ